MLLVHRTKIKWNIHEKFTEITIASDGTCCNIWRHEQNKKEKCNILLRIILDWIMHNRNIRIHAGTTHST